MIILHVFSTKTHKSTKFKSIYANLIILNHLGDLISVNLGEPRWASVGPLCPVETNSFLTSGPPFATSQNVRLRREMSLFGLMFPLVASFFPGPKHPQTHVA